MFCVVEHFMISSHKQDTTSFSRATHIRTTRDTSLKMATKARQMVDPQQIFQDTTSF